MKFILAISLLIACCIIKSTECIKCYLCGNKPNSNKCSTASAIDCSRLGLGFNRCAVASRIFNDETETYRFCSTDKYLNDIQYISNFIVPYVDSNGQITESTLTFNSFFNFLVCNTDLCNNIVVDLPLESSSKNFSLTSTPEASTQKVSFTSTTSSSAVLSTFCNFKIIFSSIALIVSILIF